jgi:hypothetical protein
MTSTTRIHADTQDNGKVRLGDWAPVFAPPRTSSEPSSEAATGSGMKVARDPATSDNGKVRLGDWAPVFGPAVAPKRQ